LLRFAGSRLSVIALRALSVVGSLRLRRVAAIEGSEGFERSEQPLVTKIASVLLPRQRQWIRVATWAMDSSRQPFQCR